MVVEISSTLLARLLNEAHTSPETEICGLLFGTSVRIDTAQACANVAGDPSRTFEIDPAALFAAHRGARRGGPVVIGHYHSHPSGLAEPSACDAAAATGDGAIWLIIAGTDALFWRAVNGGAVHDRFERLECRLIPDLTLHGAG